MIGIIGGNGVVATNRLCQIIEELGTQNGAFRDMHHPEMMVWYGTQAPSRSMFLEGRGPSFIEDYVDAGKKLKEFGCAELCMCCNTAHYAIEDLERLIGLPFINIIAETAQEVQKRGYKRAVVMCTEGCLRTKLYDKYFAKYAPNTEIVYPDADCQSLVTRGICNAKNSYRFSGLDSIENPTHIFRMVCDSILDKYIISGSGNCIIGGCTDISNVFCPKEEYRGVGYIDSLSVLGNTIYKKYGYKNV